MGGRYTRLVCARPTPEQAAEIAVVDEIADRLARYLDANTAGIDAVHVFRAQSMAVQRVVGELLGAVGFREEVVLTPQDGFVTRARPLQAFFGDERREVDVLSAHVFGYGSESLPPAL